MSVVAAEKRMTEKEFLALPDDGVERWLINGQLRENIPPNSNGLHPKVNVTVRNRLHSRITTKVAYILESWLDRQPLPRGSVLCGEAGVRLANDPEMIVGIDVVYISADLAANPGDDTTLISGVPTLVVEILSPSDTQERIDEKIDGYLHAGVPLIWVIDPHDETVLVYRPGQEPKMFSRGQELSGEPELPGFRISAAKLFTP